MFKVGLGLIYFWTGFNFVLAAGIVLAMVFFGQNAPGIYLLLDKAAVDSLDARAVATINAMGILLNTVIAAFCALVLVVTWLRVTKKEHWAFWSVAATLGVVQLSGFASDVYLGNMNFVANIVSTLILFIGLALAGRDVLRKPA